MDRRAMSATLTLLSLTLMSFGQQSGSVSAVTMPAAQDTIKTDNSWDTEHSNYPPDLEVDGKSRQFPNVSIFRILRHGCFDHDVTRFCGNRMTRFSCLYWIDTHAGDKSNSFKGGAKVEENLKKVGLDAKYFENMDLPQGFGSIEVQQQHKVALPHIIEGAQVNTTLHIGRPVQQALETGEPETREEENKLPDCVVYRGRVDMPDTWRLVFVFALPVFMLLGGLGNLVSALALARMGRDCLPICYFTSALSGLDFAMIMINAGDLWLQSLAYVDVTYMLLFACETCCQIYPMVYSFAAQMRQLCFIAIAVDTLQLYTRLSKFYPKYDKERVFNCFVLFTALLLSLNCQFLWTFSLSRLDSPGETNRGFHCGFSDKWVEVRYRAVIWPLIDFAIGEIIPMVAAAYCSITVIYIHRKGTCQWLQQDAVQAVVHDSDTFLQIRRACLLTVALELPFSFAGTAFNLFRFIGSATHMVQEHIFSPQSLRSFLGTQSHATMMDRKNKQDLYFNMDSISLLLMFTWLSLRPLVHLCCQATFRSCLGEYLRRLKASLTRCRKTRRRNERTRSTAMTGSRSAGGSGMPASESANSSGVDRPFLPRNV